MADPTLLSILSGQDPLAAQMVPGYQIAQRTQAALNPENPGGILGGLGKALMGLDSGGLQPAVQNVVNQRVGNQQNLAQLLSQPDPFKALATASPGQYSPLSGGTLLAGATPESVAETQLRQQNVTGEAMKNALALSQLRAQAAATGARMPSAQDLRSGAYQGPDWAKLFGGQPGTPSGTSPGVGGGNIADPRGLVPFIAQTAAKYGIDPTVAIKVASSEGLGNPIGDGGTSGGAFQLHLTPGGKGDAVGDQFVAQTGLDPRSPANEKATIDFALRHASQNGWGAWNGAKQAGIAPYQGIRTQTAANAATSPLAGTDALAAVAQPRSSPDYTGVNVVGPTPKSGEGLPDPASLSGAARQPVPGAGAGIVGSGYQGSPTGAPAATPAQLQAAEAMARSTNAGNTQVAQNGAGAGAAVTPGMSSAEAFRQQALMNAYGMKVPEPLQDYLSAMMLPPGPGRDVALSAAYNKGGIKPFIGGERRGSPIFRFNPQTGSYDLAVQNPQLPEGAIENPASGEISMAPGAAGAIGTVAGAQAGGKLPAEIAQEQYKPQQVAPGHALVIPQFPGGYPAPGGAPVQAPSVGGGLAAGGAISQGAPAGATPQGASGVPGTVIPGLTPAEMSEQEKRGAHVEEQAQENIDMAANAQRQNALMDRMKADVGNFPQGPLGPATSTMNSYLRYFDPEGKQQPVATAEEFNKNAGIILRQAVHDTSSRAAVQEYRLIGNTLPAQENSPMGTIRVLNEFQGLNDYVIAKTQAQGIWRQTHNGSVRDFETDWQSRVTPDAFMMYRMTPQDRQSTIQQLQQTPGGRSTLNTLAGQMQYLKSSGLEKAIQ